MFGQLFQHGKRLGLTHQALLACAVTGLAASAAQAITFTATGSTPAPDNAPLSASADFSLSGSTLTVVLTNTVAVDVTKPNQILTGVFFDIAGNPTLNKQTAFLTNGSTVVGSPPSPSTYNNTGDVGGEWAYVGTLSGAPHAAKYGISSSGLNLFGPGDLFNTHDLQGPSNMSPDGMQYGITSAGDNPLTTNPGVMANSGFIKNSVTFTFAVAPGSVLDVNSIGNVSFQYGTGLNEPNIPGTPGTPPVDPHTFGAVPEPMTVMTGLGSLAVLSLSVLRRRPKATR